jgi:hypothetical protein
VEGGAVVAELADGVLRVPAAVGYAGGLSLPISSLLLQGLPVPGLYLAVEFGFEEGIVPAQMVIMKLQFLDLVLLLLHFLPQSFDFHDEFFEFVVVEVVKLMHLQLHDLAAEVFVFL